MRIDKPKRDNRKKLYWCLIIICVLSFCPSLVLATDSDQTFFQTPLTDGNPKRIEDNLIGTWCGTIQRFGIPWPTQVKLRISSISGEICGSFEYPNEGGTGYLANGTIRPTYVEYNEVYKQKKSIIPTGKVQLKVWGRNVLLRWQGPGLNWAPMQELRKCSTCESKKNFIFILQTKRPINWEGLREWAERRIHFVSSWYANQILSEGDVLQINSFEKIRSYIEDHLSPDDCIGNLLIIGHGGIKIAESQNDVGKGGFFFFCVDEECNQRKLNLETLDTYVDTLLGGTLVNRFAKNAKISIAGCNVGRDEMLLHQLSKKISEKSGVEIKVAGFGNKYPALWPDGIGIEIECSPDGCIRSFEDGFLINYVGTSLFEPFCNSAGRCFRLLKCKDPKQISEECSDYCTELWGYTNPRLEMCFHDCLTERTKCKNLTCNKGKMSYPCAKELAEHSDYLNLAIINPDNNTLTQFLDFYLWGESVWVGNGEDSIYFKGTIGTFPSELGDMNPNYGLLEINMNNVR